MTGIEQFLAQPLVWKILAGYWVFNAAVTALPQPNGSKPYQFLYRFAHTLAGNLDKAASALKVPGAN